MNFNFSAWAIRNPVPPVLLFIVLVLLGIVSFMKLPITQFPNIDVPLVSVNVSQSGATPAELESQVTKRVEDAVSSITGVKHIQSTMSDGNSSTVIEFRLEVPSSKALEDVKDAVAKIRAELPQNVDEPIIQRIDVEAQSIQTYAVSSPGMTLEELSWYVDDVVKRQLQGLPGVGRVERYGGVDREIRVDLDPAKLQSLGVTAGDISRQINSTNTDVGAGRGQVGGQEQAIRTLGAAKSLKDLADTKIALPGGRQVQLQDVARVTDSNEEPRSFARHNGNPVVTFSVFRSKGASATSVGDVVGKKVAELGKARTDVAFSLIDDTVYFIHGNYESAMASLIEGSLLAVIVVLIFLRNWRATLISAIALPLSAIPTFWAMDLMGFSLNLVSFLGITLATGILVDDAIVEIENIARHMKMGKSPYRAALEAADEIGLAVIAITLVIIAVFVPVSFMDGIAGQYFKQFGLTVAVAVAFSLLVARLITPMLAAYFMRPVEVHEEKPGLILRGYTSLLHASNWGPTFHGKERQTVEGETTRKTYRPRIMSYVTVAIAGLILFGSVKLIPLLPTGFIPPGDESRIVLSIELPPGSSLEDTDAKTQELVDRIRKNPHVASVFVLGGASATGDVQARKATINVSLHRKAIQLVPGLLNPIIKRVNAGLGLGVPLVPQEGRIVPQWDVEAQIFPTLSDVADVRWLTVNDRGERDVQFNMLSSDSAALDQSVGKLEEALRKEPTLLAVSSDGALARPEIKITPKADEAARLGVTSQQISEVVRIATIGDIGPALGKFNAGDRLIPIRVQIPEESRTSLSEISSLKVTTASGASVPITAVANVGFSEGPSSITRYDRQRKVSIGADLPKGVEIGAASARFKEVMSGLNLPKSVQFSEGGDAEVQAEVFSGFARAAGLGLVLMLGILVLLLGNIFQPFAIILSLPLSIGGVVIALLLTNKSLSMPVVIGLLMLMGIVAKNAIMLIDFAVERVKHGMDRVDAIVDAGRKRARPIVMTTIAMAAGMLPSAYGIGEGGDFRSPMAIAVIGGLIASTILSLVFVPSFYIIMDDLAHGTRWLLGRFVGPVDEPKSDELSPAEIKSALGEANERIEDLSGELEHVKSWAAVKSTPKVEKPKPKLPLAAE
jgi:multidrug efflux pump subunit AcrB